MTATDFRKAIDTQRWVAAYNAGSYDVPPYGVCEYADSYFPDKVNKYANAVVKVKRPTRDNATAVCVNGPTRIPKGKFGRVTFDYPAYALHKYSSVDTELPEPGQVWGTEEDEFTLKKGNVGFQIIGGKVKNGTVCAVRVERRVVSRILFLNDSGEKMPAYGVGRLTAYTQDGEYHTIGKPNTDFQRFYLVNGPDPVAYGAFGNGFFFETAEALYNDGSGTPALGESWGPKPGQWSLEKKHYGFTSVGGVVAADTFVHVQQHIVNLVMGKTDAAIAKGASGAVSVYAGTLGSEIDTTFNLTAYNRFAGVGSGKWVHCSWIGGGWDLSAAEC